MNVIGLCKRKLEKNLTGGLSTILKRKEVVDINNLNSSILCQTIDAKDASPLYLISMCQKMPTGNYTSWQLDSETERSKAKNNRARASENNVFFIKNQDQSFYAIGKQKKIDSFHFEGYCNHCEMGCYYHFCFLQKTRSSLSDQDNELGNEEREIDELRREYTKKGYNKQEMWIGGF